MAVVIQAILDILKWESDHCRVMHSFRIFAGNACFSPFLISSPEYEIYFIDSIVSQQH